MFLLFFSCVGGFYPICPMLLKVTRAFSLILVLVIANSPFSMEFAKDTYGDLAATQPECVLERE